MPYLGVNKHQRFAGSISHMRVITEQTTWHDIKKHLNLQQQRCEDFKNSPIIYISGRIITNYKVYV